jgi:hypothetical protein
MGVLGLASAFPVRRPVRVQPANPSAGGTVLSAAGPGRALGCCNKAAGHRCTQSNLPGMPDARPRAGRADAPKWLNLVIKHENCVYPPDWRIRLRLRAG